VRKTPAILLAVALGPLGLPVSSTAQTPPKVPLVGYVMSGTPTGYGHLFEAARQGLRELGYVEGQTIGLEVRWAEGRNERLPELVAEMVRLKVDVMVVVSTPGALAAKSATQTIPVVMVAVGDPLANGLVASLARPGGNLTGLSLLTPELQGKRLQLLKGVLPKLSRVAVLRNPGNAIHAVLWQEAEVAARELGVQLQALELRGPEDFDRAFRAATQGRAGALLAFDDFLTVSYRARIVALAARSRLPAMYGYREFPDDGGLMSYGANHSDLYRRTATFVDKILKGAKPADLPIEQPTKFELIVNMKTAKALGLTIPPSVLARADELIQ
jgi:putative ABC transport system substrate-binding protein